MREEKRGSEYQGIGDGECEINESSDNSDDDD
jgi:hypothetical protein